MSKGKSPDINTLLAQADKQYGFPPGTMASVVKQETGGNAKYLQDPSAYHYAANEKGQRIAGHTGKVSTAFGPFGILESTAKDPGYGVKPLQSKDLSEQIRFAGEYLAARSKQAGSLEAGLAGYGEGDKYAKQVVGRVNGGKGGKPSALPASPLAMPDSAVAGAVPEFMPPTERLRLASLEQAPVELPPMAPVQQAAIQQAQQAPEIMGQWEQLKQLTAPAFQLPGYSTAAATMPMPEVNLTKPSWYRKV